MTEQSKVEQKLREGIARIICGFAYENNSCSECRFNIPLSPFPECFYDVRDETKEIVALIKEALPELAKEAGYKSPEEVVEILTDFVSELKTKGFKSPAELKGYVKLADEQTPPKDCPDVISFGNMLKIQPDGTAFRKVVIEQPEPVTGTDPRD